MIHLFIFVIVNETKTKGTQEMLRRHFNCCGGGLKLGQCVGLDSARRQTTGDGRRIGASGGRGPCLWRSLSYR